MSGFFKKLLSAAADGLFPENYTCDGCGREIFDGGHFCASCEKELYFIEKGACERCGRANIHNVSVCASCKDALVDKARSVFEYDGVIRNLIRKLKYDGAEYLSDVLAEYMVDVFVKNFFAPDIISFVPMTDKEQFSRGYNHSEQLAVSLGKLVDNEPIALLIKTKDTINQVGLTAKERIKNLRGSFKVEDKKSVKGKKILLVDDVLTTGATSDEIARVLKAAGAESVYLLTVASVTPLAAARVRKRAKEDENEGE